MKNLLWFIACCTCTYFGYCRGTGKQLRDYIKRQKAKADASPKAGRK